jgi:N utilization substance protein B
MSVSVQDHQDIFKQVEDGLSSEELRLARRAAVQFAYAADFAQTSLFSDRDFEAFVAQVELPSRVKGFVFTLARLVVEHREEIDRHIESCAHNWKISRIAKVDLAILRVCTCELVFRTQVASEIVLADAAEIGKEIGSGGTSAFVNGVLDGVAKRVRVGGKAH